jgi:ribosomal protein L7/L12
VRRSSPGYEQGTKALVIPDAETREIEAIKAHRQAFGSSLLEAKEVVEAYMGR